MRAIVTGAARGLGAAVAAGLAEAEHAVVLVDWAPSVDEAVAALQAAGARAVAVRGDVSDDTTAGRAVERARTELGGVDLLVNCAGVGGPNTGVVDTDPAAFRRVLEINLVGSFLMARAAGRAMVEQGTGGCIVNIGSIYGQAGVAGAAGYCASKAGVALLTHSLALELAPRGIRVNTIAPGYMATEMHWEELRHRAAVAGSSLEDEVARTARSVPLGRHGTGADIASAVRWLASDDAAYVTGQTIGVNGGVLLT